MEKSDDEETVATRAIAVMIMIIVIKTDLFGMFASKLFFFPLRSE